MKLMRVVGRRTDSPMTVVLLAINIFTCIFVVYGRLFLRKINFCWYEISYRGILKILIATFLS